MVYMCQGKSGALYTGISTDIWRRLLEHNTSKKGAKWTRSQRPVKLVWYLGLSLTRSSALKIERRIKALNREDKIRVVNNELYVSDIIGGSSENK
jgi:putative endonuclease